VCSDTRGDSLDDSTNVDKYSKEQDRGRPQNILRESCYHHIKCFVTNFLATLMWKRPLNSAALTTSTHRGPERVSDGTSTQVEAWMINKWRAKIF